ncbi:MAG TPA: hypothetical protein VHG93_27940 [Longimicrobium sp.]|nr:hypothetical protein [Longimicrobium sp.]
MSPPHRSEPASTSPRRRTSRFSSGEFMRSWSGSRVRALSLAATLLLWSCAPAYHMPSRTGTGEDCNGCVPRGSRAGVRFQFDPWMPGGDSSSVLTVVFDDGRQVRTTNSTEWNGSVRDRWSPYFETAAGRGDSLRVTAILRTPAGDTLAVGHVALPLQRDWWWGVRWDVARLSTIRSLPYLDPARYAWYFPLRTDTGQADPRALYARVGTRSISRPTPH